MCVGRVIEPNRFHLVPRLQEVGSFYLMLLFSVYQVPVELAVITDGSRILDSVISAPMVQVFLLASAPCTRLVLVFPREHHVHFAGLWDA